MWLTVVPFVPPVGFWFLKKMKTLGNLTTSIFCGPKVIFVPPSVSAKNLSCAGMSLAAR